MPGSPDFVTLSAGRAVMGFVVGLALGVWVALYQGHLRAYRPVHVLLFAMDLLFWLGTLVLVTVGLYFTDWMSLRVYALFAIGVGLVVALFLAGPFFGFLAFGVTRALLVAFWFVTWPVRRVWHSVRPRPRGPRRPRSGSGPRRHVPGSGANDPGRRAHRPRRWWIPGW